MKRFADLAETHISVVFFAGDKAYKLLKPVNLAFVDYSTVDSRLRAVADELTLNRRMAPDVYLGTADVMDNGEVVDRFLVMKRLPEDRRLTELVGDPDWDDNIRRIAPPGGPGSTLPSRLCQRLSRLRRALRWNRTGRTISWC